jgi:hypothetical protein
MTLLQRFVGTLLGILFLLAFFVFASIAFAVILAVGLAAWGWLWWRSRSAPGVNRRRGRVIEGEYRDETPLQHLEEREQQRL